MNKILLKKVANHIKKHPEQLSMVDWVSDTDCGTTACIAGWTCLLSKDKCCKDTYAENSFLLRVSKEFPRNRELIQFNVYKRKRVEILHTSEAAVSLLDISSSDENKLFYVSGWPKKFRIDYLRVLRVNQKKTAEVVYRRILHFIKTGE